MRTNFIKAIFAFFTFLFIPFSLQAKVLILTHAYNKPEFIIWQYKTFKKFLKDEYELIVFNDAPNLRYFEGIQTICDELQITSIDVPQKIHQHPYYLPREEGVMGPSAECAETIQYMLATVGFSYPGVVAIVDSDMFLIQEFSIENFMRGYQLAAYPWRLKNNQNEVVYLLPNLMFFDMRTLPDKETLNFNLGTVEGVRCDTGGHTYYYLSKHPDLKWRKTNFVTWHTPREENLFTSSLLSSLQSIPNFTPSLLSKSLITNCIVISLFSTFGQDPTGMPKTNLG